MDKKRVRSVAAAAGLAAFGVGVPMLGNPYLGIWLLIVAAGCLVIVLKPEWVSNRRLFGAKKPSDVETAGTTRVGIDTEGGGLKLQDTHIRKQDTAIRSKNTDVDATNLDIE